MYNINQIQKAIKSPKITLRELNRLYHSQLNTRPFNTKGIDLMSADWDNLIILDACRYDMYADIVGPDTSLTRVQSRGSGTEEFLFANLSSRRLHDTVYITANPQFYRHQNELNTEFHAVKEVWRDEGWDQEYGTVLPETMVEKVEEASEQYGDKRILAHFLQPHYPFLTEETEFDKGYMEESKVGKGDFWRRIFINELSVDKETIWRAYKETLSKTLPLVTALAERLPGKTVITSDHGNMVGERSKPIPITEWGHPLQLYTPELINVPWHEFPSSDRKQVSAENPAESATQISDDVVSERLADLGYV